MVENLGEKGKLRLFKSRTLKGHFGPKHPCKADFNANVGERLRIQKHGIGMKKYGLQFWNFPGDVEKCPNPQVKKSLYSELWQKFQ